jgi:hypothetical protein
MRWWQRRKRDGGLECEVRSDLKEDQQRENGLPPGRGSLRGSPRMGNTTLMQVRTHEAWGWAPLERYWQDLRCAWRQLRRLSGLSSTAILVLSLGIGASVALFGFTTRNLSSNDSTKKY